MIYCKGFLADWFFAQSSKLAVLPSSPGEDTPARRYDTLFILSLTTGGDVDAECMDVVGQDIMEPLAKSVI
jgi:hypothetical protein